MKKHIYYLFISLFLLGCQHQGTHPPHSHGESPQLTLTNLQSTDSQKEVERILKSSLDADSVDRFLRQVIDYNQTVSSSTFLSDFTQTEQPVYDVEELDTQWRAKKGDFLGMNCRLTCFSLLKDALTIPDGTADSSLLFFDLEAIQSGKLLDQKDAQRFERLFSRVETVASQDETVHAQKMAAHLSGITFPDRVSMVSVVLHDNLDGDSLFIGHTGVLVPAPEGYLFIEKVSFQEPYQFIRFSKKEEVFDYLRTKYAHYASEGTAAPFIMENDRLIALETKK